MAPRRGTLPILIILLVAVGCAPPASPTPFPTPGTSLPEGVPSESPASVYPLTLTDDAGREVTIGAEPERVVSLAPSNTEIVCALDACDRIVGVTDFDDFPPEMADVEKVVIAASVDVEAVVAAEPDLVIAAGNELTPTPVIEQLTDLGLVVLTLYPESLDEVYDDIGLVGRALDLADPAADLVSQMRDRVAEVEDRVEGLDRPRAFYEVGVFEGVIYTAGDGSFLASLMEIAGAEPITGDAVGFSIELEELVAADPQLILLGDASYDPTVTPESVAARPGWETMTAVAEGRIVPVLEDVLITRPGPRIVDGLEALARAIHPDAFSD